MVVVPADFVVLAWRGWLVVFVCMLWVCLAVEWVVDLLVCWWLLFGWCFGVGDAIWL